MRVEHVARVSLLWKGKGDLELQLILGRKVFAVSLAQKTLKTWCLSPNVEGTEVTSVHHSSRVLALSLRFIWA